LQFADACRRASTTDEGGTVWHGYVGSQCAADFDASGNPLRAYTWGLDIGNLLALTVSPLPDGGRRDGDAHIPYERFQFRK
jgi:hypothetical protein